MGHVYIDCQNNSELCQTMITIHNSQQDFIVKLIILFFLLFAFLYFLYKSKEINPDVSYYYYFRYIIQKYVAMTYILFAPLFFLLLTLDKEMFLVYLFGVYGIGFAVILALVSLWGKEQIFNFFSKENINKRREKQKYGNN